MSNIFDTPADTEVVLPFTVTFYVQNPLQADNLAEFFHHHGLDEYFKEGNSEANRENHYYLKDFRYDEDAKSFYGVPKDQVPAWQKKPTEEPLQDIDF